MRPFRSRLHWRIVKGDRCCTMLVRTFKEEANGTHLMNSSLSQKALHFPSSCIHEQKCKKKQTLEQGSTHRAFRPGIKVRFMHTAVQSFWTQGKAINLHKGYAKSSRSVLDVWMRERGDGEATAY